jgi:hypothetical protein
MGWGWHMWVGVESGGAHWSGVAWRRAGRCGESRLECDLVRGGAQPGPTHLATPPPAQIAGMPPPQTRWVYSKWTRVCCFAGQCGWTPRLRASSWRSFPTILLRHVCHLQAPGVRIPSCWLHLAELSSTGLRRRRPMMVRSWSSRSRPRIC